MDKPKKVKRDSKKIEFIEYDDGSWFWAVVIWVRKGWLTLTNGVESTYEDACKVALEAFQKA